jgi:hypothetical protein
MLQASDTAAWSHTQLPAVQQRTTPFKNARGARTGCQVALEVGCLAVGDALLWSSLQGGEGKELVGNHFKV